MSFNVILVWRTTTVGVTQNAQRPSSILPRGCSPWLKKTPPWLTSKIKAVLYTTCNHNPPAQHEYFSFRFLNFPLMKINF